jgi:glycosyltransferase involved in cell wall biosynthesis
MKIAVWHNLPSGGGKRLLHRVVEGLLAHGHRVEAWCPPTADASYLPLRECIPEHVVPFSWDEPSVRGRLSYLLWEYRNMADNIAAMDRHADRCATEINGGGFDVLFAHACRFLRVTAIGRLVKMPTVLYLGEPFRTLYEAAPRLPWLALPPGSGPAWAPKAIKRSLRDLVRIQALRLQAREECDNAAAFDQILVNSYFSRESVLRAYGVDARVCYPGIASDRFLSLGLPRERVVVGLGAIDRAKGVDTAIRAIATIPEAQRPELLWVGNYTNPLYQGEVEVLAKTLSVKLVTKVSVSDAELVDVLNRAAVMIYASRLEPFGMAPLEANACGMPVVAIAEGGIRETIVDGMNGLLVRERRPELIGQALARVLDDHALARALGERGRACVVDNWSWEKTVQCVEDNLEEVVARRLSGSTRGSELL